MIYQTGTANDNYDLLDKLRLFLIANGWTVNSFVVDQSWFYMGIPRTKSSRNSANQKRLHVSKNGKFANFRSYDADSQPETYSPHNGYFYNSGYYADSPAGIGFNMSTGYDGTKEWCSQPGSPNYTAGYANTYGNTTALAAGGGMGNGVCAMVPGAVVSYHFFVQDDPFVLQVSIEHEVGKYQHLFACDLIKSGSYSGGLYFTGSVGLAFHNRCVAGLLNGRTCPFVADESHDVKSFLYFDQDIDGTVDGAGRPWLRNGYWNTGSGSSYQCVPLRSLMGPSNVPSGISGKENLWQPFTPGYLGSDTAANRDNVGYTGINFHQLLQCTPADLNGIMPLTPIQIFCGRAASYVSLLGTVPDAFLLTSAVALEKTTLSYGGVDYVLLPMRFHLATAKRNLYLATRKV